MTLKEKTDTFDKIKRTMVHVKKCQIVQTVVNVKSYKPWSMTDFTNHGECQIVQTKVNVRL